MTDFSNEHWRDVPGFEGLYMVSDLGRMKSLDREIVTKKQRYTLKGRILKPQKDGHGYLLVNASVHSKITPLFIHQTVLAAFVGKRAPGIECRHLNGDFRDNRLENLAYGTKSDNMQDALRHGTLPVLERRPGAKLTRQQVREIFTSTDPNAVLMKRYNIGDGVVRQIKLRETWRSVTADLPDAVWDYRPRYTPEKIAIALDRRLSREEAAAKLGVSIYAIKGLRRRYKSVPTS